MTNEGLDFQTWDGKKYPLLGIMKYDNFYPMDSAHPEEASDDAESVMNRYPNHQNWYGREAAVKELHWLEEDTEIDDEGLMASLLSHRVEQNLTYDLPEVHGGPGNWISTDDGRWIQFFGVRLLPIGDTQSEA